MPNTIFVQCISLVLFYHCSSSARRPVYKYDKWNNTWRAIYLSKIKKTKNKHFQLHGLLTVIITQEWQFFPFKTFIKTKFYIFLALSSLQPISDQNLKLKKKYFFFRFLHHWAEVIVEYHVHANVTKIMNFLWKIQFIKKKRNWNRNQLFEYHWPPPVCESLTHKLKFIISPVLFAHFSTLRHFYYHISSN